MINEEEFYKKLMASFREESQERIQKMAEQLLVLEKSKSREEQIRLVESIFREVHSLKSAARAVNNIDVEKLCAGLENVFSDWKKNKTIPNVDQFDFLHKVNNCIDRLINNSSVESVGSEGKTNNINKINTFLEGLEKITAGLYIDSSIHLDNKLSESETSTSIDQEKNDDTVRIASQKLDALLMQTEEMQSTKMNFLQQIDDLGIIKNDLFEMLKEVNKLFLEKQLLKRNFQEAINVNKLSLFQEKMISFLECNEKSLKSVIAKIENLSKKAEGDSRTFNLEVNALMEDAKKLIMLPMSSILNTFPRIVRDLARRQEKDVNFIVEGAELEMDKRILSELKDALLHIIRNAIDHGIEKVEDRLKMKKTKQALLKIRVRHLKGNEVSIEIQDDGSGINVEKIKALAVKQGLLTPQESQVMPLKEAQMLIFQSGISTSPIVTELSGRGLGMTIIREKIEKLSGKISIQSELTNGTTLTIQLPLTLATFKGLLVSVENQKYVMPTSNLERIIRIQPDSIRTVENKETIVYDGQTTALIRLNDLLGNNTSSHKKEVQKKYLNAIVVVGLDKRVVFVVDEVLSEQEILVKNFSKPLVKLKFVAAAAILGTGKAVPILNTHDLLQFSSAVIRKEDTMNHELIDTEKKHILLAEDSITTRLLLKNILELGGYEVTTAVDGREAWNLLKTNSFSAVVSDIEMPNMNGFELTDKIRNEKDSQHLPVILVTSLESDQDRETGIEVGANAYILKSTFDSNVLLNVIQRLMIE